MILDPPKTIPEKSPPGAPGISGYISKMFRTSLKFNPIACTLTVKNGILFVKDGVMMDSLEAAFM
jgi:hypothetical protein